LKKYSNQHSEKWNSSQILNKNGNTFLQYDRKWGIDRKFFFSSKENREGIFKCHPVHLFPLFFYVSYYFLKAEKV
jgi:hypothetical protein